MPTFSAAELVDFTCRIFQAYGVSEKVATIVADSLVLANLKGHDSHGIIRVIEYVDWVQQGWIEPESRLEIIQDRGAILITDGHFGFGQVIGREATELAIRKTQKEGVCILTIRHSGHLGRIGEFMEMAADERLVCFSFTNTHGGGVLAAPYGGRERRLSANPLGGGAPLPGGDALVMDIATCAIAEGKIKVARAKGDELPPGCIVDAQGEHSTDPAAFYGPPPGALLPIAGHKGYALALFAEVFAGALSGAGCSKAGPQRVANAWFAVFVDPAAFCGTDFYQTEMGNLVPWVKLSEPMRGFDGVLMPGEPEARTHEQRQRDGIPIEDATWQRIVEIAESQGVDQPEKETEA